MDSLTRDRVYGVDFSGAKDAGKRIWIAAGSPLGDTLLIESCRPAEDLPGSNKERDGSLRALREMIGSQRRAAFGLDFPFGLPQILVGHEDWLSFVLTFPEEYPNAEAFREICREAAQGRELRRLTDQITRTPFSPYNIRLYRQTYYGIRDVLHALVQRDRARVLPMQEPAPDMPWLLEICPASTLKQEGLYTPYKGCDARHCSARKNILEALERKRLTIGEKSLRATILQDVGGDALDSVVAALTMFEALRNPPAPDPRSSAIYQIEGYVYVTGVG